MLVHSQDAVIVLSDDDGYDYAGPNPRGVVDEDDFQHIDIPGVTSTLRGESVPKSYTKPTSLRLEGLAKSNSLLLPPAKRRKYGHEQPMETSVLRSGSGDTNMDREDASEAPRKASRDITQLLLESPRVSRKNSADTASNTRQTRSTWLNDLYANTSTESANEVVVIDSDTDSGNETGNESAFGAAPAVPGAQPASLQPSPKGANEDSENDFFYDAPAAQNSGETQDVLANGKKEGRSEDRGQKTAAVLAAGVGESATNASDVSVPDSVSVPVPVPENSADDVSGDGSAPTKLRLAESNGGLRSSAAAATAADPGSSDDEIAILSKEEAERVDAFRKTHKKDKKDKKAPTNVAPSSDSPGASATRSLLFGAAPEQTRNTSVAPRSQLLPPLQPAQPAFNQPAPVLHAGDSSATNPILTSADVAVKNHFTKFNVSQLQQYERNLDAQIRKLQKQTDTYYAEVQSIRTLMLELPWMHPSDERLVKKQVESQIADKLRLAHALVESTKKTRRYRFILESVKTAKLNMNPYYSTHQGIVSPPGMGHNSSVLTLNDSSAYPTHVNPYMTPMAGVGPMGSVGPMAQNDDHVHLEKLFKDLYREEKVEGMVPTPDSLKIQLLDHQRRGLYWLMEKEKAKMGCILADDMGLGKTVQTLAVMMANAPVDAKCRTTLIVGPVSLLRQWHAEIEAKVKPSDALTVAFYHGQEKRRLSSFKEMSQFDVVLTSYTTLASEFKQHYLQEMEKAMVTNNLNALPNIGSGGQSYLSPFYSSNAKFFRIVLDEAQYIRNKLSQASKAVACLRGTHRLCLTGTPMQNSIEELYPILRFLGSKPYDDERKFKQDISVPLKSTSDNFDDYDRNLSMKKLRAVLLAIMLRRTKDSKVDGKPLIVLPEKTVEKVFVEMEDEELDYYRALEKGIQKKAIKLMASATKTGTSSILTLLLRLRQACIHQLLVEVGELNAHEKSDSFNGRNWVKMYQRTKLMNEQVKAAVRSRAGGSTGSFSLGDVDPANEEANGVQLTCPVCFDVVGEDSIVILANCGHMVCDGCLNGIFQKERSDAMQEAPACNTCGASTTQTDLVDYLMFSKVVNEGSDVAQLEKIYGMPNTKKSTNSEKVAFLIRRDEGFTPSAKMDRTMDIIRDVVERTTDEKIIVFSHFTTTFDLMGFTLKLENIGFLRYDGSMNIDEKNKTISEFYSGNKRVLLLSLKAGNVGLTLTCASHVVLMDPFWNPYVEDQAMDRAHRFGQERPVKVYRLLMKNSVEDRITELQDRKKELIGSALDEKALKSSSHLGRRELGFLFGLNSLQ